MYTSHGNSLILGIEAAKNSGFTTAFFYRKNAIHSTGTGVSYTASQCMLVSHSRYEGMTDPADASILFLVACKDGTKGYLSSAYGIYANTELIEFMQTLHKLKVT
ncbi:MAG: hypothetical protein KJN76_03410 [Eudoraea sp.]|nr:hypothetical protein [Eudoraea sp.]